jgi:hypothetical protein
LAAGLLAAPRLTPVHEPGTVSFFLSFPGAVQAEHARALLGADGFTPLDVLPPDSSADAAWSLAAERELACDEFDEAAARVRELAATAGGTLDTIAMPWPEHPSRVPLPGTRG